jgi:hypothetical protein
MDVHVLRSFDVQRSVLIMICACNDELFRCAAKCMAYGPFPLAFFGRVFMRAIVRVIAPN